MSAATHLRLVEERNDGTTLAASRVEFATRLSRLLLDGAAAPWATEEERDAWTRASRIALRSVR